tara:strand:+ start:167 stop:346 length:180 start_codon:yes stop_codon:yes gene_type:complete
MPSHEQVERFFIEFAREMTDQGQFIMDKYTFDWPNLPTEDQLRDRQVENQYFSDDSDGE